MAEKYSGKREKMQQFFLIAALCFTGWGQMSDSVVVPLATSIYEEFPNASLFMNNFVLSGSCLIAVPFALLSGMLTRRFSQKKILVVSILLFTIGGLGGYFSPSIEFLAVTRAIDGASDGISVTLIAALISELFTDERLKSNVFGWNQAVSAVFGIVMATFAGWAAVYIGWRYAFLLHIIDFITLFLVIRYVPDIPPQKSETPHGLHLYTDRSSMKTLVSHILVYVALCTMTSLVYYTVDLYVTECGFGNALLSGELSSVSTIGMLLFDLAFGVIFIKTRRFLPVIFTMAMAVCFALLYSAQTVPVAFLAMAVYSFGAASITPYYELMISKKADPRDMAFLMGIFISIAYLMGFVCPYLMTAIGSVSGDYSVRFTFLVCVGGESIIMIGYLIRALRKKELDI